VVMFAVDDMCDWIGPMGYTQAVTPNMDRLAARGVTFTNAHTAGVYCAPSRTAIFTGRHASTTGCYRYEKHFFVHPQLKPLQKVLQDGGYATYGAGKLFHHGAGCIDMRGWTEFFVRTPEQKQTGWPLNSWPRDSAIIPQPFPCSPYNQGRKITGGLFLEWGTVLNKHEPLMADTIRTDWACKLLKKKHDKPVFVGVGLYAPHFPNYAPEKYFDLYDPKTLELPPYKDNDLDDLPPNIRRQKQNRGRIHKRLEELGAVKDAIHGYLASISYADAMLGRVLDAIKAGPNADNTIVFLWSDHGYHHGEKLDWGKHTLWERTSNVPFIWAGPGIAEGRKIDTTASLIDIFPTLTDLCDLADAQNRDGTSLAPALKQPESAQDRNVLLPGMKPNEYAIMNRDWRYIRYADGAEELYDLKTDPNEWENLAANPELAHVKKRLAESAPKTFAQPADRGPAKLVIEGERFKYVTWEDLAPDPLPDSVKGVAMVARKSNDESQMEQLNVAGRAAWKSKRRAGKKPTYFYFLLADEALRQGKQPSVQIAITYLDRGNCKAMLQYDSSDTEARVKGAFKDGGAFHVGNSGKWKTAHFNLDDARFAGRSNGGDIRLGFSGARSAPIISEVLVKPRKVASKVL